MRSKLAVRLSLDYGAALRLRGLNVYIANRTLRNLTGTNVGGTHTYEVLRESETDVSLSGCGTNRSTLIW